MRAKTLTKTLCLMLTMFLLLSASAFVLPVTAADGTLTATVNGSSISTGAAIPANSTIEFTIPYALTSGDVAANVVFEESSKETEVAWNSREFSYTLAGDTLTVAFPLGTLAMNGSYRFTFKDPAGTGADVPFAFTTTAVSGYAMYDNFERYPVGTIGEGSTTSTAWKPFTRYYMDTRAGNKIEVTKVGEDKVLRMGVSTQYMEATMVGYMTGFSGSYSDAYVTGDAEFEFTITPGTVPDRSIFEMGGIGILPKNLGYEIYAKTTYSEIATSASWFKASDWTLLDTITFADNIARDAKHTLKIRTTTTTSSHDTRVLNAVEFDGDAIGTIVIGEGLALATGNHNARIQGVLYSQNAANKHSMTMGILNGGAGGGGSMDIYSISYMLKAPIMELSVANTEQLPVNGGVSITFDEAPTAPAGSTVEEVLEDNLVLKKGGTTISSGITVTAINSTSYLLTAPFEPSEKYTLTIPDITFGSVIVQGKSINFTTDWKQLTAAVAGGSSAPVIILPANTATSGDISLTIPAGSYELTNLSGTAVDYKAVLALYRKEGQSAAQQVDEEILTSATVAAGTPAALPEISVSYTDTKYNASTVSYFAKLFLISNDSLDEAKALSEPVIFGAAIDQGTHSLNLATVSVTADTDTATLDIKGTYGSYTNYKNRALWVYVTNDNGSDVFYDQLSSGTNGKYAISVLVDPQRDMVAGTYYNEYTVYVVPSRGMADDNYDEFDFDNVAPSADPSNMTITDNGTTDPANRTLTATYVYFDALDRAELGTTVTWKYADTADATTWTAVDGDVTTDTTLAITEELVGKYITCVVTPKNAEKSGSDYDYRDENTAVLVESLAPQVAILTVTDVNGEARKLKAEYTLSDPLATDRTGDTSEIKWYIADSEDDAYTEITAALADQSELPLTVEYAGKYIKCAVIPQYNNGTNYWDTGRAYDSKVDFSVTPYCVKYRPVFKEVTTPGNELKVTQSGNTITVDTTLNDPLNHESDIPDITWTFKNSEGTVVKTISGTPVTTSYTATAADNGLTLIITAVPKIKVNTCAADDSCTDIAVGDPVESAPVTISYQSGGVDSFVGGNSGGSYGGGTSGGGGGIPVVRGEGKPVEENSAPVYQSPDEEMSTGALDLEDARGHWAEKEIFELYDKGIIKGKTANTFDPDGQITRAEFMAILVRAMGLDTVTFAGDFADVAAGSWYADILATAKQNGLLQGSGGYANPDQAITREEMVQIIVRAYEAACGEIKVGGGLLDYADASAISGWAQMAVIKANEISLVKGTGDGCFSPLANTTRAQSAVLIVRLMPHLEKAAAEEAAAKAAEEAEKAVVEENITDVGAENAPAAE